MVVGSRLRATRALLVKEYSKNEQETVTSLLHNIGPQISINSPLHKLPCLLQNRLTQGDAFYYLDRTQQSACHFERNVAGLCSDLLAETQREYEFYQGLKFVYQTVVNSKKDEEPRITRNKSAAEFARVFSKTRYIIKGEEFLPDSSGHIFIMNHLVSHPQTSQWFRVFTGYPFCECHDLTKKI